MVYCGRPSANCALCRAKKRRCDKATPACGQCCRAGQKCPGYHDASSLRVRDETTRVIDRARTLKAQRIALASSSSLASRLTPSSSTQDDNDDVDDGEEHSRQNDDGKDGKGEKGREEKNYQDDVIGDIIDDAIENVIDDGHQFALDEMDLFIKDAGMPWEPGSAVTPPLFLPDQSSSPSRDWNETQVMSMLISPAAPSESLHELGISYFLTNYVVQDSGPCPGFLNYTMDILTDPLGNTELAQVAIRAVGLAGLATATGANGVMCKARSSYAEAIEMVNAALVDSRMTCNDSTIFTVMVLGLFEAITCSSNESLEAWKNHINGAANLLILRDTPQFRTIQGLQIFGEALSHVLTICSRYGHPMPPRLRLLRVEMERRVAKKTPSWDLGTVHIEVMDLYHLVDARQETPFMPNEWEKLLSRAAELHRRLENLVADLPVNWRFKTVSDPAADPRVVYQGTYHIYYNTWVAKVWDGIRACRLFLDQAIHCLLVREGLAWAPHELSQGGAYGGLLQKVWDTTVEMRDGIFASVPQMLGFVHHESATGRSYLDCSSADIPRFVPASGAYFLLWYLFLAGSLPINSLEARAWAVERLRAIRSATGILKASFLADILENNPAFLGALLLKNEFLIPI